MLIVQTNLTPSLVLDGGAPGAPAGPLADFANRLLQPTVSGDIAGIGVNVAPYGAANPTIGLLVFLGVGFILVNGVLRLLEKGR